MVIYIVYAYVYVIFPNGCLRFRFGGCFCIVHSILDFKLSSVYDQCECVRFKIKSNACFFFDCPRAQWLHIYECMLQHIPTGTHTHTHTQQQRNVLCMYAEGLWLCNCLVVLYEYTYRTRSVWCRLKCWTYCAFVFNACDDINPQSGIVDAVYCALKLRRLRPTCVVGYLMFLCFVFDIYIQNTLHFMWSTTIHLEYIFEQQENQFESVAGLTMNWKPKWSDMNNPIRHRLYMALIWHVNFRFLHTYTRKTCSHTHMPTLKRYPKKANTTYILYRLKRISDHGMTETIYFNRMQSICSPTSKADKYLTRSSARPFGSWCLYKRVYAMRLYIYGT